MRKLLIAGALALAVFAGSARDAEAAGPCGLPDRGTAWVDYADGMVPFWYRFARPGVIAAASNFLFPPKLRAGGAKTVYFDLYLNNRAGTPAKPTSELVTIDWAHRIFYRAVASSACSRPWMALNELFGAHTTTPWTANNAQYRHNVLVFAKTLRELGARPFILISSKPYTQGDAGNWWREAAHYADLVQEVYFSGRLIHRQGPVAGSRTLRNRFREAVKTFTDIGIPPRKVGIMLGFMASNRGTMPAIAWFEHVKLQALAARQVARETGVGTVWSWGWQARNIAQADPDKEVGACIWLWARDPRLCAGPEAAGPDFDRTLTQGQISLARGVRCEVGGHPITHGSVSRLARVTGDSGVAFSAAYSQAVLAGLVELEAVDVLAAERAIIRSRFRGSRAAYRAALARAGANQALAREVIADELRQQRMGRRFRAPNPTSQQIFEYHENFSESQARMVEVKPRAWWLGDRRKGLAIAPLAPPHIFSLPAAKKTKIRTADGIFEVTAQDDTMPLGAFPLGIARNSVVAALKEISRRQLFERWFTRPLNDHLDELRCADDQLPAIAVVDMTTFLPFLTL
ncbi:MAG: hypothetical protein M3P42_08340 [Actinomycetota bacterium]|nr:hypothetical protein [Actinomycetota bacterium]